MTRLKVLTGRKGKDRATGAEKTYWTKIGMAFPRDDGGYSLSLDALPLTGDLLLVPDDGGRGAPGRSPAPVAPAPDAGTHGDDVPF